MDIRHGPTELDIGLQNLLIAHGRERLVVLTKADKVKRGRAAGMRFEVQKKLGLARPPLVVSVKTGEGRKELLGGIDEIIGDWRATRST